ncbi:hypothetical protein [Hyphomonas sp.]|uniref:hypothetical protein n=1 Tax=Hyphomonas sp. TaxID=87 RepID=UPI00391B8D0A
MTPRLMTLQQAKAYLAGLDPRTLQVAPHTLRPLRFDRRRIDAALDGAAPARMVPSPANDEDAPDDLIAQELAELDARLAAPHTEGASAPARRAPRR